MFDKNFAFDKFESVDLKYDKSYSKLQPKNTHVRHFWSQIQDFLFLHETLHFNKFEDLISNMKVF